MTIHFYKYHGTGNDFVLIDNREQNISLNKEQVAFLCHRRFGIGADGLMLLRNAKGYDFRMVYYNADGGESTMCGNGGRCITAFARKLGIITNKAHFIAIDGEHEATIDEDGIINLHMQDVADISSYPDHCELNTGSPHYILETNDIQNVPIVAQGREIRYNNMFMPNGINVNFVQKTADGLWVRTYERGVEDETLSCGTGVTASAIAATKNETGTFKTNIITPGGKLTVSFTKDTADTAKDVVLTGPAAFVFKGEISI